MALGEGPPGAPSDPAELQERGERSGHIRRPPFGVAGPPELRPVDAAPLRTREARSSSDAVVPAGPADLDGSDDPQDGPDATGRGRGPACRRICPKGRMCAQVCQPGGAQPPDPGPVLEKRGEDAGKRPVETKPGAAKPMASLKIPWIIGFASTGPDETQGSAPPTDAPEPPSPNPAPESPAANPAPEPPTNNPAPEPPAAKPAPVVERRDESAERKDPSDGRLAYPMPFHTMPPEPRPLDPPSPKTCLPVKTAAELSAPVNKAPEPRPDA